MKFELPELPYDYGALEPYIDALTMEIHHRRQIGKALKKAHEVLKRTKNKFAQLETTCSKDEPVAVFASKTSQSLMVQKDKDRIAPSSISKGDSISVELSKRNIKRVLDSIHHLRAFARQSQMVFSPFHVNKVLEASFQKIEEQFIKRGLNY